MHVLSERHRIEFLAVPQLVRFTMAIGAEDAEPALLIKTTTLELKYLLRQKRFHLLFVRVGDSVAYAVEIEDDPKHPGYVWSFLEFSDEIEALRTIAKNPWCPVYLFNELGVNVAEQRMELQLGAKALPFFSDLLLHSPKDTASADLLALAMDALYQRSLPADQYLRLGPFEVSEWLSITSHYITNRAIASPILLFGTDEGEQQEHLALWLIDILHPGGAIKNPQVEEPKKPRELCDVLLNYEKGMFLIESKTLSVFTREKLPSRAKLESDISKHIEKAVGQLAGAVRNAKKGYRVYDGKDNTIELQLDQPLHVVVLVPDLTLLHQATEFDGAFFREACARVGGFFHILDPAELLRTVQAAQMVAGRSETITPMMAWDWYLIERSKVAVTKLTPNFNILFRRERDPDMDRERIIEAPLPEP